MARILTRNSIIPLSLLLFGLAGCSSDSSSTSSSNTTTPSTYNSSSSSNSYFVPSTNTSTETVDATSSATILDEEDGHSSTYQIFYQHNSRDELLLDSYPSADYLVFQALSLPYVFNSDVPIDIIHQSVKESLGDRYDSVRESYSLLSRDQYYSQLASSSAPWEITAQYSMSLSDLPSTWYQGLSNTEIATVQDMILDYYDINDLLSSKHYSGISGIEPLISFANAMCDIETYVASLSEAEQASTMSLVNRTIYHSEELAESDYTVMVSEDLTVRELMNVVSALDTNFRGALLKDERNLSPARIGFYATSRHYGMSVIESITNEVSDVLYSNVTETLSGDNVSTKTARLYLPIVNTDEYYILTLQEIIFDEDHIYSYVNVGTATISTFNTIMAQDLHKNNVTALSLQYGLTLENFDNSSSQQPSQEEQGEEALEEGEEALQDGENPEQEGEPEQEGDLEVDGTSSATPAFHTVDTQNGNGEFVQVDVPHFPRQVAVFDYVFCDVASSLGLNYSFDPQALEGQIPTLLLTYVDGEGYSLEMVDYADFSTLAEFQPNVIYANKQSAWIYDELSSIAPVVMTDIDDNNYYSSFVDNLISLASIYGCEAFIDGFAAGYDQRIASLQQRTAGKHAILVSVREGIMTVEQEYGSLLFQDIGFANAAGHLMGQTLDYGTLAELNPEYLLVLDHDGSFGGADCASIGLDVTSWTLLDGGVTGMDQMLADLEQGIS